MLLQEENKILDKMHRNKVCEVEKLSTTVHDLEEAVLAGGAAVNAARDYQRQVHELMVGTDFYTSKVICFLHSGCQSLIADSSCSNIGVYERMWYLQLACAIL